MFVDKRLNCRVVADRLEGAVVAGSFWVRDGPGPSGGVARTGSSVRNQTCATGFSSGRSGLATSARATGGRCLWAERVCGIVPNVQTATRACVSRAQSTEPWGGAQPRGVVWCGVVWHGMAISTSGLARAPRHSVWSSHSPRVIPRLPVGGRPP